ncbi:putative non-specific serine/threonine protein kinase [Medicago truncatula]|uniref:Putative non-specific serine/threonine protein kinase n=1 Tax=Medicago truncatula TaxID=3880 RepID=A0A396IVJ3_MEDTR|nr:putative non-specific serine/threonine protein kinase [Medicago truncatula]
MMTILTTQMSLILLLFLSITTFHKCMCSNHTVVRCNEKDLDILLTFKHGINNSLSMFSRWSTEKDCCVWEEVHCDNIIGRVTEIDLSTYFFEYASVKVLKGEMNLCILDLDLGGVDLHKETNWFQVVNSLSSLLELQLFDYNLNNFLIGTSIRYLNLSSLVTLNLDENNFTSHLPNGFFNLTNDITSLDLALNNIYGEIPSSLLNLQNLRHLDLSNNQLQGSIIDRISQLPNFQYLDISANMFSGLIPSTVGNLSSLKHLFIGSNNFSGEISNLHFSNLSTLFSLDLSNSNFVFQFDLDWVPPFQLYQLSLRNTNQGPNFPFWIYTQKSLEMLDLSSS